ncbi:MAG: cell division FtsA domain-containing protein [Clostridia bacterium]
MQKREVAILDVGSSKMRILIGERGVNDTFNILGRGDAAFSGFSDGAFIDEGELKYAIGLALSNAETNSGLQIKKLYIGVPAEFSVCECKTISQNYPKRIKINDEEIKNLFSKTVNQEIIKNQFLVNSSAVYYVLDDNRRVLDVLGQKTTKLSALVSNVYADKDFVSKINAILQEIGIEEAEYVSSPLAEAQYLLSNEEKDRFALIVDCGYISTSVALVRGNGLLLLNSFSLGGGHVAADLSQVLKIPFAEAENLKNKIILSVSPEESDCYEIVLSEKTVPVPMKIANSIVSSRVEMIAGLINKCLSLCKQDYPEFINVSLTGGGLSYIKGAKDYIAKSIGRNVNLISPKDPQMNKPHFSSVLGLLDFAIKKNEKKKRRFLANWF